MFCASKLSPPCSLPPSPITRPLSLPAFSALTCCTSAIAEKQQPNSAASGRAHTPVRTYKHATKSMPLEPKRTKGPHARHKLTSWVLVFLEAPATKTLQHMRSFAENVAPNKPHGFGRDGDEGGGGGEGEGEGGGGRGGGGREALRMRQTKIHPPHGSWSAPLFACQQSRPAVGLSSAVLRAPNLHHRQEYEQVARLLAQFLQKPREQHLHVFRVVVVPARQEKSNLCSAFLRELRLRLPQRPVVLSGGGTVTAAGTAARPPRREKPPSAPFQMASSAARRGERSGSGGQACGGASVKSAVRGSCRLLHKKPLHISGDGRSRCVRPSVRGGEGCRYQAVRQKVCGIPVTSTAAGVSYQTHTHTHGHTRRRCRFPVQQEQYSCAGSPISERTLEQPGESGQGISIPQPRSVSFLFKKKKKSLYEFYLSPQLLIIHKLQCAKILLLMLSVSSSSPPLPHPLLHLGDIKKLQPLTSSKLFAAAATGTGGDQALDVLLSASSSAARETSIGR